MNQNLAQISLSESVQNLISNHFLEKDFEALISLHQEHDGARVSNCLQKLREYLVAHPQPDSIHPTQSSDSSALSEAPASPKKPLTPRKYIRSERRLKLEKVAQTILKVPTAGKCTSVAIYIDTLFRWLDYAQTHWHQGFITLNHHKIAKKLDINIRTSKRYLAEAKKLGYFHIMVIHHPKYGKELMISRIMKDRLSITSTQINSNQEISKVIHKRDNLVKVKGQPDLSNPFSIRVPAPLLSVEISADKMSRSGLSSAHDRPDPQIFLEVEKSNPSTLDHVLQKAPTPSPAKPEQTTDDDFAMKTYAIFMLHIAIQFSPTLQINQKMFAHLLKPLWKSHFGSLEAFEAYCLKIASNPFLTGKKPNKDGKFWQLRLQHILTGKMVEQSWVNEGFFNVYEPRKPEIYQESGFMAQKMQPIKLSPLTLAEVTSTAKNEVDLKVKTALFQKLGGDIYKSWFFDNGFTFDGMDGLGVSFTISGKYARKIISERYSHLMVEVLVNHCALLSAQWFTSATA